MDYDVSISIGTQADLGGLRKAQQAVDGLAKAAGKVPGSLLSGGVGGASAPPVYTGTVFSNGGMSWQLEGASELTGSIKQVDKTIGAAAQGLKTNSSWLSRSISALAGLPGKIQDWGKGGMDQMRRFNGGFTGSALRRMLAVLDRLPIGGDDPEDIATGRLAMAAGVPLHIERPWAASRPEGRWAAYRWPTMPAVAKYDRLDVVTLGTLHMPRQQMDAAEFIRVFDELAARDVIGE